MKKFLMAMIVGLIICAGIKAEAAVFDEEQFKNLLVITAENPAAAGDKALPFDAVTFQKNFNDYMTNFIKETNANDDESAMMKELFFIGDPPNSEGKPSFFGKNFVGKSAIIGLIDEKGNLKILNLFVAPEDKNDSLAASLILQAFFRGILTEPEAESLLEELNKKPSAPIVKNGVKYSISKEENLSIITAIAE